MRSSENSFAFATLNGSYGHVAKPWRTRQRPGHSCQVPIEVTVSFVQTMPVPFGIKVLLAATFRVSRRESRPSGDRCRMRRGARRMCRSSAWGTDPNSYFFNSIKYLQDLDFRWSAT